MTVLGSQVIKENETARKINYYPWIDVIRTVCCLTVIVTHCGYGGWWATLGVNLFFAISGWLITEIILKDLNRPNFLMYFYSKKLLRIYPAYLVAIVFYGLLFATGIQRNSDITIHRFVEAIPLFLTFNYDLYPVSGSGFSHIWSICVEERFYLIWPAICILCLKLKGKHISFARYFKQPYNSSAIAAEENTLSQSKVTSLRGHLIVILVLTLLTIAIAPLAIPEHYINLWHKLPAPLLFGCLLATVNPDRRVVSLKLRFIVALVCFTLLLILGNGGIVLYGTIPGLLGAVIVWAATGKGSFPKVKILDFLRRLGQLSYGAYLIHIPFCSLALRLLSPLNLKIMAPVLAAVMTLVAAKCLYEVVEKPVLKARKFCSQNNFWSMILAVIQISLIPIGLLWISYN